MKEREYKLTLTEENKSKVEQFLKLLNIDVDIVEDENVKESEENEWLKYKDTYYSICSDGDIMYDYFDLNSSYCIDRLAISNVFKTREEAEFELERLRVIAEIKKFAESEDREWDGINRHWYPYYDITDSSIKYTYKLSYKSYGIYFASEEEAQKCVDTIGEDRIKKFYLGIKE